MPKKVHTDKTKIRGGGDALRAIRAPFASRFGGGTKSRAALALAVSLWIATGGVASAEEKTVTVGSGGTDQYVYNGATSATTPVWAQPAGEKTEYHTVINGGTATKPVWGGFSYDSNANSNTVTATSATIKGTVYGGCSERGGTGNAKGNTVMLTDTKVEGADSRVYGGSSYGGNATGNTITLIRSIVSNSVVGGYATDHDATGNTVSLTDSTVGNWVSGGSHYSTGDVITGNTLNLSGENTAASVKNFVTINITGATWGTPALTLNGTGITQNDGGTKAKIDASTLAFANPETIANGDTMNLMECVNGAAIVADLAAATTAKQEYTVNPVAGVTVNAALQGNLALTNTALTCTAENKATKLTFGNVEWKDSGALLDHSTALANVSFNGAAVDTSNINFTNLQSLEANKKMTLVSSFGDTVGTITGAKYKVGTTLEGEGKASLVNGDLIFTAETGTGNESGGSDEPIVKVQEQTHNTVMGAAVGMAALSTGNDFILSATEGLSLTSNVGTDGIASFAKMGGAALRQETGSHIDVRTWNAILALGHANKKERGTMEYGAFFEYGTGNYTTHAENDLRGDGSARYTGGGLLAKWTANHGFYVEGSLRAGTVHDDARNVLSDGLGNPYSYDTNANYFGGHVGVGKEFTLNNGNMVDVYGKYFVNRKNGVDFNAGGQYNLDAVTSQILRVGARYTVKGAKWDFYAGAAYEHELDGKANGTADGVAIRGADTSGGSFRGELGATVTPDKNVPVTLDFNLTGFAGKKQGVSGGVSVALMF